ncbi:uroporphyrinogen-III synthase [Pseudorhodoplanes sp.]|uniref:uroporphyrinogen-III synthase n=1 Tax=Pseudorhodoplanes sp. TaxID=1934341 RepID=UPI00391BF5DA
MRVLLTRPLAEAERTAEALRALGHQPVMAPLLLIEPIADARIGPGPFAAVLMTSGNAARAIAGHPDVRSLLALDCYAVGSQTAAAARAAGFRTVEAADGDGGDLARLIGSRLGDRDRPLLYLAGEDRARDMAAELSPYALRLELAVVYRAVAAQRFAPEIAAALRDGQLDAALHFSRRSTAIFIDCIRAAGAEAAAARMMHVCLSANAAEPLAAINVKSILVAQKRDEPSMLALLSAS